MEMNNVVGFIISVRDLYSYVTVIMANSLYASYSSTILPRFEPLRCQWKTVVGNGKTVL